MPLKKYNSVAVIAFSFEHDDYDEPTEEELRAGFAKRFYDLMNEPENPITNAVSGDISDTCENLYDEDGNYPGEQVDK
jgi:hypothetical protein